MDITVVKDDFKQIFNVKSEMDFRFLISLKVRFVNYEIFENGVLEEGMINNRMIGFKESEASIRKTIDGYDLLINGSKELVEDKEITYSVSKIYTQEPVDGQKVYSQYYGKYFTFEETGLHHYKFSSPEGDNYYTYEQGICTDIKIERDFATIFFKLKPESLAAVKSNAAKYRSQ